MERKATRQSGALLVLCPVSDVLGCSLALPASNAKSLQQDQQSLASLLMNPHSHYLLQGPRRLLKLKSLQTSIAMKHNQCIPAQVAIYKVLLANQISFDEPLPLTGLRTILKV